LSEKKFPLIMEKKKNDRADLFSFRSFIRIIAADFKYDLHFIITLRP